MINRESILMKRPFRKKENLRKEAKEHKINPKRRQVIRKSREKKNQPHKQTKQTTGKSYPEVVKYECT